ncbi:MAG: hypothetical protein KF716_28515, partial [Anaerolineae bacterium]|nr:hypothetical protein [Anaerolineae bacterium]
FTVVGKFEDEAQALHAAQEIRLILKRLQDRYSLPDANIMYERANVEGGGVTPFEQQLGKEYGFEWNYGINWYMWAATWYPEKLDPVSVANEFVFITNPHPYIYYGPQPFDAMVQLFGGEITVYVEESLSHSAQFLELTLRFTAPTEDLATALVSSLVAYFTATDDEIVLPPWFAYHEGKREEDPTYFRLLGEIYISESRSNSTDLAHQLDWEIERLENLDLQTAQDYTRLEQLRSEYAKLYANRTTLLTLTEMRTIRRALTAIHILDAAERGIEVERVDKQIVIQNLEFDNYAQSILAIHAWLRDIRCTDIDYEFVETKDY